MDRRTFFKRISVAGLMAALAPKLLTRRTMVREKNANGSWNGEIMHFQPKSVGLVEDCPMLPTEFEVVSFRKINESIPPLRRL
jgi:hypothetical protein